MKGYSKIKLMNSKSDSMDSSDETIKTPRIKKPISIKKSTITVTEEQPKTLNDDYDYDYDYYSGNNQEQDENVFMEKLRINRSANSQDPTTDANGTRTLTSRLIKIEKQHSTGRTMQTSVKRVMLIRRSSSVSERYSRIYDQCSNPSDDDDEQDEELKMTSRSKKNMKKTGSIFKACKRVFGF
ncbi:hypothetical protein E3N88_06373 [Mikania micrantha]|uniref:Uncharacterized protein n=1 Tax=Mikania micrantha TaxID=192012 RepID=A0A5N6PQN0_9ASTR|nr:hypothetical protein E3N88_06373 [Mikania micrantha]